MFDFSSSPRWLEPLLKHKFFNPCLLHETTKKSVKNIFCLDCCTSVCRQCISPHRSHRLLQMRRYIYHDVIRLGDLEKLIDCSLVQSYTANGAKVVFLNQRPQPRPFRGPGNICHTCRRNLQDPYLFCSLACKVHSLQKKKRLSSKHYYEHQLLPVIAEAAGRTGESSCWELEDRLIRPDSILESPILFQNSPVSAPSHSAWCRELEDMAKTELVNTKKNKRSSVLGPLVPTRSPEMSVHSNRRKGNPHRSPLY